MRLSEYNPLPVKTDETSRVLDIPSVTDYPDALAWADATFKQPWCKWNFRRHQAEALWVMANEGGLIAPIGVGDGKTLIFYLASKALGVSSAVGMMPPRDVIPYEREARVYEDAGFIAAPLTIVPYSTLSSMGSSMLLDTMQPDAIIADEVHSLANPNAARTRRFLRYMEAHPETKFVGMSGTLYATSVADVAHLAALALRTGSPLPRYGAHLEAWKTVLDVGTDPTVMDLRWFRPVVEAFGEPGAAVGMDKVVAREAARQRFVSAPGVVSTDKLSCDLPLTIRRKWLQPPPVIMDMITSVQDTQIGPDGEALDNPDACVQIVRDLSMGFFHRWDWSSVPGGRNEDWLMRRRAWNSAVSAVAMKAQADADSIGLVTNTVDRELREDPEIVDRSQLHWLRSMFLELAHIQPARETIWVDKYLIDWVDSYEPSTPAIFWYEARCIEEQLASRGWSVYGQGSDLQGPERRIAASWRVHGQARRLHEWNRGVVLELPGSGKTWEQLLGRMHRAGQTRSVTYDVVTNRFVDSSLARAREHAEFIQSQSGPQRLLAANWTSL